MGKLAGKVALVSGSGRGIGRATAMLLAREGARVVVNDLDDAVARQAVADIAAAGGTAVDCVGSVTDDGFADRFIATAIDAFGGVDVIVNNAGYTWDGVIHKMTDEQFDAMIDVHLKAPFRILRAASAFLREASKREAAEGREVFRKVVNISSTTGVYGNAGQVNYAAGKAGIVGITKSLAREWGRYKVNVNSVAFGYVMTRMTQAVEKGAAASVSIGDREVPAGIPAAQVRMLEAGIPLGRGATPDEAAGAIALLCYPESNYVTGHVLMATGGL
ncbi:MAG TPA: SDR family oxidoreductase [Burkholderiaceae bacterium]|nr:SDR family oxidoreductase [Burkholderiaceae bacterium]